LFCRELIKIVGKPRLFTMAVALRHSGGSDS
jgi:hypothetical protein